MKYDFGFRFELGGKVGSGHFYRCYALAKLLKRKNKKIVFLTSDKVSLKAHLQEKIPCIFLKGKKEEDKLKECKKQLSDISIFIIDLPIKNSLYGNSLPHKRTVIIDDLGKKIIPSKILINGQLSKKFQNYNISKTKTEFLSGVEFMILRESFSIKNTQNFKIKKTMKKILISFTSANSKSMIKILTSLSSLDFQFTILLRPGFQMTKSLEKILTKFLNIKIIESINNPTKLFLEQDLVITHVGIVVYELATLGIPCIMMPLNKNQDILANDFQRCGYGLNVGMLKHSKLINHLEKLEDQQIRQKMKKNGKRLIDGKGAIRVTNKLLKLDTFAHKES